MVKSLLAYTKSVPPSGIIVHVQVQHNCCGSHSQTLKAIYLYMYISTKGFVLWFKGREWGRSTHRLLICIYIFWALHKVTHCVCWTCESVFVHIHRVCRKSALTPLSTHLLKRNAHKNHTSLYILLYILVVSNIYCKWSLLHIWWVLTSRGSATTKAKNESTHMYAHGIKDVYPKSLFSNAAQQAHSLAHVSLWLFFRIYMIFYSTGSKCIWVMDFAGCSRCRVACQWAI